MTSSSNIDAFSKYVLLVDASGVGFGGLRYFLEQIANNISLNENIHLEILGANELLENLQPRSRVMNLSKTFLDLYKRRDIPNAVLYSISPSISSLAWLKKPMIQNFNDFQSFSGNVRVSLIKKLYRKFIYRFTATLASEITTISETTRMKMLENFPTLKRIRVITLSGEIDIREPDLQYDFLIIAHSFHKNANYILEVFSDVRFSDTRIAILGSSYDKELFIKCAKYVRVIEKYEELSNSNYANLIGMSDAVVMNSYIGTEGYGLPIAQGIFASKKTYISSDEALVEVSAGRSRILYGDYEMDRKIMFLGSTELQTQEVILRQRTWSDVSNDILDVARKYWAP